MIQVNFYSKSEATFLNTKLRVVFLTSIDYLFGSRIHLQIHILRDCGRVVRGEFSQMLGELSQMWGELSEVWGELSKVTVDLQSAFRKMLCLRHALEKTMVNYISLES